MPWLERGKELLKYEIKRERERRLVNDKDNTLHNFYWKNFIWSKHQKGKFWPNLFSSGGLQEESNRCFETILTSRTENSPGAQREFFIYLNYILGPKYNKGFTHCLPIRYFIYAMAAYLIYFSKNKPFCWTIFKYICIIFFLCFWKYMS